MLRLSQERMARLLGVSFASVNRWEGGHSAPIGTTMDVYRALDAALKNGYDPVRVVAGYDNNRGEFLRHLFVMAYGRGRRGES